MFDPRVAAASLSGQSDASWARAAAPYVGAAFLGGIALDDRSRAAARAMVSDRDREEFLPADPFDFIEEQLLALQGVPIRSGINVRSTTVEPVRRAGAVCRAHDAILEVNGHCRQDELCAVGCGETLLRDTDRLVTFVDAAAATRAVVSVKVRAEVDGVDLPETARAVAAAGAQIIHIDAMDSESVIAQVVKAAPDLFVIANNGVRDRSTAHEYFGYGADAVSVGRPSDNPAVLKRVRAAADGWFREREAAP